MITAAQKAAAMRRAAALFKRAGLHITPAEKRRIEVADFGLSKLEETGLEILTYVNTKRCCAKELALFPGQTCPEHRHPPRAGQPGKEETFRCRWGLAWLYLPGKAVKKPKAKAPEGKYTVWHEIILRPGDQVTLPPGTRHWFQGGPKGAVVSEFSTASHDASDIFTDPRIQRMTKVASRRRA